MKHHYNFNFRQDEETITTSFPVEKNVNVVVSFDDCAGWTSVLREFTAFLSSVYGYNISESVFIKEVSWDEESDFVSISNLE